MKITNIKKSSRSEKPIKTFFNKNKIRMLKCYNCGFVSNKDVKFCPNCQENDLMILLLPIMEKL